LLADPKTEALERAKTMAGRSLSLILSDINMPGMSGLEMPPKVKAARPNVPVIMITACGDEATKKKAARTRGSWVADQTD
jgi:CheY-like chemotaxis protein